MDFYARHPEWWVWTLSLLSWAWIIFFERCGGCAACSLRLSGLGDWSVMVVAMMFPLMIVPLRVTAFGSLWRRRHWAMAEFLAGYLMMWMGLGLAWTLALQVVSGLLAANMAFFAGFAFLVATIWQTMSLKRRFLASCHRTMPLAPNGWRAHRDCLRFGAIHGYHCIGNCSILMLASMLSPWHDGMMAIATVILLYERYRARPQERTLPMTIGLLAVWHVLS